MVFRRRSRGLLLRLPGSCAHGVSLAVALLAFVVLPALHLLQHEREARTLALAQRIYGRPAMPAASSSGIQATLHAEHPLLHQHEHAAPHEHQPAPGPGKPERSQHGKGALEHFSVALVESYSPCLPGPSGSLEYLPILVPPSLCPVVLAARPNTIRGPPLLS